MSKRNKVLDQIESMPIPKNITSVNDITDEMIANFKERPGRPVDPNSERQKHLAEMEAKRQAGLLKRGRPSNPDSEHAKKKAELEARKAEPNYKAQKGRPTDPTSKRQAELA